MGTFCRDWGIDTGFGADVLQHEIGVLTQWVARPFDLVTTAW